MKVDRWTRRRLFLGLCLPFLAILALGSQPSAAFDSRGTHPLTIGPAQILAEIAMSPEETARGLMFRRHLPENQGMLFVFPRPRRMSFWMRNTGIALDIGFFDADGRLREIYPLHPHDERPVRSQSADLRYALEVNRGWYLRNGVDIDSRMSLNDLAAALGRAPSVD